MATVALPYKVTNDYNVLRIPKGSSLLLALDETRKLVSQYVEARSTKSLETFVVYCFDFDDVLAESHCNDKGYSLHIQGVKNAQDAEALVAATAKMLIKTVKDSSYNCIITSRLGEEEIPIIQSFLDKNHIAEAFPQESLLFLGCESKECEAEEIDDNPKLKYTELYTDSDKYSRSSIYTSKGIYVVAEENKGFIAQDIVESYCAKNNVLMKDVLIVFFDDDITHHEEFESLKYYMKPETPTILSVHMPTLPRVPSLNKSLLKLNSTLDIMLNCQYKTHQLHGI